MKAVLFARVACCESNCTPLPTSLQRLREYAKAHDIEIVGEITQIGVAEPTPPCLLSEYLRQHTEVSAVLTTEPSRILPTPQLWVELVSMVKQTRVDLHFVDLPEIWTEERLPSLELAYRIRSAMSEYYLCSLRESIRKGQTALAQKGRFPGRVPFGYRVDGGSLVAEPAEAAAVRTAYERFASGHTNMRNLQQALSSTNGIRISPSALSRILRSRFYLGEFLWGGRQYTGNHPALVELVTFKLVQRLLARLRGKGQKSR
ncbi:MAG: recombinase family protein [Acidobacteria bacterium]|nr:recombinase family protein [Acidobacteriota bacterium]